MHFFIIDLGCEEICDDSFFELNLPRSSRLQISLISRFEKFIRNRNLLFVGLADAHFSCPHPVPLFTRLPIISHQKQLERLPHQKSVPQISRRLCKNMLSSLATYSIDVESREGIRSQTTVDGIVRIFIDALAFPTEETEHHFTLRCQAESICTTRASENFTWLDGRNVNSILLCQLAASLCDAHYSFKNAAGPLRE
jgi:hypothetical protein